MKVTTILIGLLFLLVSCGSGKETTANAETSETEVISEPSALSKDKGPKGDKGDKGDSGAAGDVGSTGATGTAGATGASNSNATYSEWARGKKGSDLTANTELTLPSDGDYMAVSGTTTITSLSVKAAGTKVNLHFSEIVTLQYSAVNPKLLLKGKGSFTTSADAVLEFISLGDGDWKEIRRSVDNESFVDAYHTTTQTIVSSTHTNLVFNTEVKDTQGEYDNATGIFTAKQAGRHTISANIVFPNTYAWVAGTQCALSILHNTTGIANSTSVMPGVTKNCVVSVSKTVDLAVGDTVVVRAIHDRGSDTDLNVGARYNTLSIVKTQ